MKLRDLKKANNVNDGNRTLLESILIPEVNTAFNDWIKHSDTNGVLIGGLALSYYVKPRYTTDIDILFMSDTDIPNKVNGFKRHRKSAFQHNKTHVEIEVLPFNAINITNDIASAIFDTAIESNGIKIASPEGLIAAKLHRGSLQDIADIGTLIEYLKFNVDLSNFKLSDELLILFKDISDKVK